MASGGTKFGKCEGMYEAKMEFLKGWGLKPKNLYHGRATDIFWAILIKLKHW